MTQNVLLDLNGLLRMAVAATTRAAAFLALGPGTADQTPPASLALGGSSNLRILPDPLPIEVARSILSEWRVGSSRVDLQACKLEYSIVSPK